jgi:hypothetical protein
MSSVESAGAEGPIIRATCIVTINVFDLRDDARPDFYVPADKMAELITKAYTKEAHRTVREQIVFNCSPADFQPPVREARAKVEVRTNVQGAVGFSAVSSAAASWMFQLRDELIGLIEDIEPPKSAWVRIGTVKKAPKGAPSDRSEHDAERTSGRGRDGKPRKRRSPRRTKH